jgi:MoaA/NifB/PqqE/SkfB family radical SAM enzyme
MSSDSHSFTSPAPSSAVPIASADITQANERIGSVLRALKEGRQIAVTMEATSYCNLECDFCGMHSGAYDLDDSTQGRTPRKAKEHLRYEVFCSFVEKMAGAPPFKALYFHGHGEPLLNKELPRFITTAKERQLSENVVIVTNGTLLTGQELVTLVRAGTNEVRVSLDVMTPAVYAQVKGRDMGQRVVANIHECLAKINEDGLPVRFTIESMKWRSHHAALSAETALIEATFQDLVAKTPGACIRWREEFGWVDQMGHRKPIMPFRRRVPCELPFYNVMIHSDGKVSACCADSSQTLVVGDLSKAQSFREIYQGRKLQMVRRGLLNGDFSGIGQCRSCDVGSVADEGLLVRKDEILPIVEEIEARSCSHGEAGDGRG